MIAVVSGKGGTGKTTTSLGLASVFAERRRRPIVVDLDLNMPDIAVVCEIPDRPGVDALAAGEPLDAVTHPVPELPGVAAIPATPDCALGSSLKRLPADRPVILDCPSGASVDVTRALRAAGSVVLVTRPEPRAVTDVRKVATLARRVRTRVGPLVCVGARSVPERLVAAVDAPAGIAIPCTTGVPLQDSAVRAGYRRVVREFRG